MYAKVISCGIRGINGILTYVEADSSNGLPSFSMVGNLSSSVREAGDRVRTALKNSGIDIPAKKVTINISPADIKKDGTGYDLPIAIAILKSLEIIKSDIIENFAFIGELNLSGDLVGVSGILSMVTKLKEENIKTVVVSKKNELEAILVDDINIVAISNIKELIDMLNSDNILYSVKDKKDFTCDNTYNEYDFSEINGQDFLKRACIIAVSGNHNILISGSAGTGKTMIAKRIPTIMPKLTYDEEIEITKIYSIAGLLKENGKLITKRPFRSPHHSISLHSFLGGGVYPMPGEISLSSNGVLFLDEFPLFSKIVIESLREPLEEKYITITRLKGSFDYPANFMLVAAMNPCPCGFFPDRNRCKCSISVIEKYQRSISKPILERIDICAESSPIKFEEITTENKNETSDVIREKVTKAREIQKERFKKYVKINYNSQMTTKEIKKFCIISEEDKEFLRKIFEIKKLSARTYHKILKVARTIADYEGEENIKREHLIEASNYRGLEEKIYV